MDLHIAQVGTGRVGRPTSYTIMCAGLAEKITVCDVKPNLAKAFAEELYHVAASLNLDVEINWCDKDEDVREADIILVSAGTPRLPGDQISRRDLAIKNAEIIRHVAEKTVPENPNAKYIIITNPVDAMATVFKKFSDADFVIGTGTNLETLRFRSKLARELKVPVSEVKGWVGGEHGDAAVILWSTVRISNLPVQDYSKSSRELDRSVIEAYMKEITRFVIDSVGGTEYGPAASFRDIVRAIVEDRKEILPIATLTKFREIPEPVYVSVPLWLGSSVGPTLFDSLTENEKNSIKEAAKTIFSTYRNSVEGLTGKK